MKTRLLLMGACVAGLYGCNAANKPSASSHNAVAVQGASPMAGEGDRSTNLPTSSHGSSEPLVTPTPDVEAQAARDAVAERATRYAQEMERSMAARQTPAAAPKASQVDWAQLLSVDDAPPTANGAAPVVSAVPEVAPEPVAIVATPTPQQRLIVAEPMAKAVPLSTRPDGDAPTANAGITLDGQPDSAPMVVPEGQEIAVFAPIVPMDRTTPGATVASLGAAPVAVAPKALGSTDILSRRIAENPRDVAAHLDYQLQQFAQGKSVPELTALAPLPVEDREVIAAVMDGLSNFRASVQADGNQLLSKKVRPLVDMTERLQAGADLSVPTIALCRRVNGFGVYEPIDPATFPAGRETPVILYCEVANFSSQKADGKQWETTLAHSATLYRDSGVPVWSDKTTNVVDHSRNRRNDFFVVKMLRLPATLTPGRYVLKVSVVDRQSNRMAEGTTTLAITSGEGMAKTE